LKGKTPKISTHEARNAGLHAFLAIAIPCAYFHDVLYQTQRNTLGHSGHFVISMCHQTLRLGEYDWGAR